MKKVLLFAVILAGSVAFTSCGSDECVCTIAGETESFDEDDADGVDLEEACEALDAFAKLGGGDDGCSIE